MLAENGALADILGTGARVLECGCGPCIGMGQAPCTDGVSLRTFNRNFKGRSGTVSADIYLHRIPKFKIRNIPFISFAAYSDHRAGQTNFLAYKVIGRNST